MMRKRLSTTKRQRIYDNSNGRCYLCDRKLGLKEWEVEHLIPLSLGGPDDEPNLAPVCKPCHARKTKTDVARIAKAKRQRARHIGAKKRSTMPGSRNSKWKKPFNGPAVPR